MIAESENRTVIIMIARMIAAGSAALMAVLLPNRFQRNGFGRRSGHGCRRCRFQLVVTMQSGAGMRNDGIDFRHDHIVGLLLTSRTPAAAAPGAIAAGSITTRSLCGTGCNGAVAFMRRCQIRHIDLLVGRFPADGFIAA